MSNTVKVNVKWNKQVFDNVEVDLDEPLLVFKSQLFALTNVPPDRQKLLGLKGALKDDTPMSSLQLKPGQTIMLMGTPGELPKEPVKTDTKFVEDMAVEEQYSMLGAPSAGLQNLGNTCYMNATLQCLKVIPELKRDLLAYNATINNDLANNVVVGVRNLFQELDNKHTAIPPALFLAIFRQAFPQFAQRTATGFAQQDADEAWSQLINTIGDKLKSYGTIDHLFQGEMKTTLKCAECDEPPSEKIETFKKLECHISKDTNYVLQGLKESFAGTLEKFSETLQRTAVYNRTSAITRLPPYLQINFVRFFWKPKEQVKAKILKDVKFPMVLDVFDLCTEEKKKELTPKREELRKKRDEELAAKKNLKAGEEQPATTTTPMEVTTTSNNTVPDKYENETGWYELCAVLTHKGRSADSGHYVAWIKSDKDGTWIKYDDDKVSLVNEEEIKKLSGGGDWHMAYITLWRSRKADGSIVGPPQ